jgi:glycosyltransferase involved in cell wall biosynthesis
MKILILTRSAWDNTNSLGNTMTNFWSGVDSQNIAHLYCRAAPPYNNVCHQYYSVFEKELIRSIINRHYTPGKVFKLDANNNSIEVENKDQENEERLYSFFRKNSFVLAQWGQELLWKFGRWQNYQLDQFIAEFSPDIIFAPCFSSLYMHKILWYVQEKTNAKVVLFHADDYLTVKGLGGSFLSRINRRLRARTVAQSAKRADLNYCISPKQQEEYSLELQKEMKILFKGADFSVQPVYKRDNTRELIRIVYVGSTLYGRWKTLGMLARAIQKINADKPRFELLIYSQYQPSPEAERTMVLEGASCFMGKVPATQVSKVLNDADIVLHVESFDERERALTRLSFSTKIVDCLHSGRCVLAIGWKEAASIDYLIKNDAALVATDENEIMIQLQRIINSPYILEEYAQKAWKCGKRNHQINKIQKGLYEDLAELGRVH